MSSIPISLDETVGSLHFGSGSMWNCFTALLHDTVQEYDIRIQMQIA